MKCIVVSQRVDVIKCYNERRDALDQRWARFLAEVGCIGIPVFNHKEMLSELLEVIPIDGILLTGGTSSIDYGGSAFERDAVDRLLISYAVKKDTPLLGVCKGMQSIIEYFGGSLHKVDGHVATRHGIDLGYNVNSYHNYSPSIMPNVLKCIACSDDGEIEYIRHTELEIYGIMWHPEREYTFAAEDIKLFRKVIGVDKH